MVEAVGPMIRQNGSSGGQQVYINVGRIGQEPANNRSLYRIIVQYRGNGNQGWSNQGNNWSASSGPFAWGGSFSIRNGHGGDTYTLLDTTFWRNHDTSGNDSQFNSRADVSSTNRAYIGAGMVQITEPPIPGFARKPSNPGEPKFTNVLPTSVTVSWTASTDNGGAPIDSYLLRYWPNAEGLGPYVDHSTQNNLSRTVTGLTPGKTYRFVVYAHNSSSDNSGFSLPSVAKAVQLFVGVRVKVSGVWKLTIPYIKINDKWVVAIPFVKVAGTWKRTG